ncbi:lrr receptor-like serine threonine-protein kinase [Hordeum vulgare]|nr:lrr receptor-like serine threonine-protein kinase [Hordeum vulgare]
MAEAHGDAGAAVGDVVELQGAVTADEVKDVGGIHGGPGKLATDADVEKEVAVSASVLPEQKVTASSGAVHPDTPDAQPGEEQEEDGGWGKKRKLAFTGFDPYDLEYSDEEEYEYDSGEDVYKGNFMSFTTKEVEKIKAKGVASFYNRKIKKWRCPYCTTKPKPKDGCFDLLMSHAEDVAIREEDYMIRGQHVALAKALTPPISHATTPPVLQIEERLYLLRRAQIRRQAKLPLEDFKEPEEEAPPKEPEVEASPEDEAAPQQPEVEAPQKEPEVEAPPQEPDVEAPPQEPEVEAPPVYYLWPDQVVILNSIRSEAAAQARRLCQ